MNYREAWANGDIEAGTLVDRIDEQAREIERLRDHKNEYMDAAEATKRSLLAELAAMKAQLSGVVLSDLLIEIQKRCLAGMDGAAVQAYGALNAIYAMIDEVARLNSSPVSACWVMPTAKQLEQALESVPSFHDLSAELIAPAMLEHLRDVISAGEYGDAYRGARDESLIWKRRALEAETEVREQDQIIENLGNALNAENGPTFMGEPVFRAGVVDERAAFEVWRLENFCGGADRLKKCSNAPDVYYYTAEQEAWKVWQARAALTAGAPNHSEQVRHMVREGWQLVPVELLNIAALHLENSGYTETGKKIRQLLAESEGVKK